MANVPSGCNLHRLARKTLSREENDNRAISHQYLTVLLEHLYKFPGEQNFLMDLEDGGGTITCLDCWTEVLVANSEGQLDGLNAFWAHIATPEHQGLASDRIARAEESLDLEMDSDADPYVSDSFPSSYLPSTNTKRRIIKTVQFSDGEFFNYSTDEDEQPQPSAPHAPSMAGGTSSLNAPYSHTPSFGAAHSSGSLFNALGPSGSKPSFDSSSSAKYPPVASSPNRSPFNRPRAFSNEPSSDNMNSSSFTSSRSSAKRPRRGIRRLDFGGGDVIYLSTDDEDLDERPSASVSKKTKLGGALIKSENGIQMAGSNFLHCAGGTTLDAYHTVANNLMSPHNLQDFNPDPVPDAYSHDHYVYPDFDPAPAPTSDSYAYVPDSPNAQDVTSDVTCWPVQHGFSMPGDFEMGYHAPPVTGANSVLENAAGYDYRYAPGEGGSTHATVADCCSGSFNLNFDQGALMGPMDVDGLNQTQPLKDFFISAMEDFQETPKVVDAAHKLGLENTSDVIPGLEVQLMPHQLIGVSWMVEQEAKPSIRGGILADDMGLGKTVQCIAMCAMNRPMNGGERKSTLIVAPAALLEQWAAEFKQRASDGIFRVHIHHGKDKLKTTKHVRKYHVVITTYQTLCTDFPKEKERKGKGKATEEPENDSEEGDDILGPLAATPWYRVVLDEAQCVRNRLTRSSRCVARLDSIYRWALTGTPVTNTLSDIFGLVRFLQFPPFNEWKEFNDRIAKVQRRRPDLAGQRAQALLKKCLLRRTKNTKLEGKPILQLPPKHIEVVEVDFSPEEREIYTKIEERQKQKMSKFLKAGTVMKNYAVVLVMLLRLRQVCNHPQLLALDQYDDADGGHVVGSDAEGQSLDSVGELKRVESLLGAKFVEEARAKLREQAQARIQAEVQGTGVEEEDTDCPICFDTYVNNCRITSCKHLFCGDCLNDLFKSSPNGVDVQDAAHAEAMQNGTRACPVCRGQIHPQRVFKTSIFEPSSAELDAIRVAIKGPTSTPEIIDLTLDEDDIPPCNDVKGKGKACVKDETDLEELELESLDQGDHFEPSAKMIKMASLLKEWHETAPDDKIICYSQWTSMIDLVEKLLGRDNINTVRFDGRMSRISRDEAVARFKRRDGPSIMLISLKCGGVGLNLVEANRVMCLDLAWNAATENQAFDRVHRMGQQKDVHVKRLIVRNTVEERILHLQATKQSLADAALGEGKAQKIKKMSVGELKALFGM